MSTATKRGKLLPDLLVARDAILPSISYESPTRYADLDAYARSRPSILKWVLVKRADVLDDTGDPSADSAVSGAGKVQRAAGRKRGLPVPANTTTRTAPQRRVATESNGASPANVRPPAEAIFCEKGDATPAVSRPWCWDYEHLAEGSLKSASCGRRAKSKARQNSP
jgi:hypothetical protein